MKAYAPAAERNQAAILEALKASLPPSGLVLEIASGTGQHAAYFAAALPHLKWQPSDANPDALSSIDAWSRDAKVGNVLPSVSLDVTSSDWDVSAAAAIVCINMLHIAPWSACKGLMAGAAKILGPSAILYLYGPFIRAQVATAPSNLQFDASLRSQNPSWGVRSLEEVSAVAAESGFAISRVIDMPANNVSVVYTRR